MAEKTQPVFWVNPLPATRWANIAKNRTKPYGRRSKIIARIEKLFEELDFQIIDIQGGPSNRGTDVMAIKSLEDNKSYGVAIEIKSNKNLNQAIKCGIETLERVDSQTNFDKLLLVTNKNVQIDIKDSELIKQYQLKQPTNI